LPFHFLCRATWRRDRLVTNPAGEIFGEIDVINGGVRTTTATAAGRIRLMKIRKTVFLAALANYPAVGESLCRMMAPFAADIRTVPGWSTSRPDRGQSVGCNLNNAKSEHLRTMQVFTGSVRSWETSAATPVRQRIVERSGPGCPETPMHNE
jgi:hypothetical protein